MATTVILLILITILIIWKLCSKPSKYPPAAELSSKYGDVVGLYLGSTPLVIISGLDTVKAAGAREDLSGRPRTKLALDLGLIFSQGDLWREQRRFTLRHLRDLGFGKHSMQGLIHEEEIDAMSGQGQRYEYGDARLQTLLHLSKELLTRTDASGGIAQNFPILLKLCPRLTEYDKIVEVRQKVFDFIKEDVLTHREKEQLLAICKDLFVAGSDTTFNSITYALVYMLNYQNIQRKVQEELDNIVGQDRLPALDDRQKLVYTEATLQEIMRMSSAVPLAVPHAPLENSVQFHDYIIPKNTRILLNISHVHMDRKIWGDPEMFRPERFIDDDGKLLRPDALMSFGSGKRQCLGESLARNNVFLTFTAIMQRYCMLVPSGEKAPSLKATGGFTIGPEPFHCLMKPRF
ncbi:hypothetical protein B566_EDAN014157 [Ephemera danica]|nr:hypothetical protein B566_EDAN014157 [Ephemera danica]